MLGRGDHKTHLPCWVEEPSDSPTMLGGGAHATYQANQEVGDLSEECHDAIRLAVGWAGGPQEADAVHKRPDKRRRVLEFPGFQFFQ